MNTICFGKNDADNIPFDENEHEREREREKHQKMQCNDMTVALN